MSASLAGEAGGFEGPLDECRQRSRLNAWNIGATLRLLLCDGLLGHFPSDVFCLPLCHLDRRLITTAFSAVIARKSVLGHEVIADLVKPGGPAQRHGADEFNAQMVEHGAHALGAVERKPPDHGACRPARRGHRARAP